MAVAFCYYNDVISWHIIEIDEMEKKKIVSIKMSWNFTKYEWCSYKRFGEKIEKDLGLRSLLVCKFSLSFKETHVTLNVS